MGPSNIRRLLRLVLLAVGTGLVSLSLVGATAYLCVCGWGPPDPHFCNEDSDCVLRVEDLSWCPTGCTKPAFAVSKTAAGYYTYPPRDYGCWLKRYICSSKDWTPSLRDSVAVCIQHRCEKRQQR